MSTFDDGYRSHFRFALGRNETVRGVAEQYVRDWLGSRKNRVDTNSLDQWDGTSSQTFPSGTKVEMVSFEDERSGTSAIRYRVTDRADVGEYRVTVTALGPPDVTFVVQVARTDGDQQSAIGATTPPRLVPTILDEREVFDGETRLSGTPESIRAEDVDLLIRAVKDQKRQVPVVVASSPSPAADENWRRIVKDLMSASLGTAAVFTVSSDAVELVNEALPEPLRVRPGHIRFIAPKVNWEQPDLRRHPLMDPQQVGDTLDADLNPTGEAQTEVAYAPRKLLLDGPLPSSVRRTFERLDQLERRVELERRTETRAEPTKFPTRAQRHRSGGGDFWPWFRKVLAGWLEKSVDQVTDDTIDSDLRELDQLMVRRREALKVHEEYLSELEAKHSALQTELAELREENESLAAQLEKAGTVPVDPEQLELLQQRLNAPTVNAFDEIDLALGLLTRRLGPIIEAKIAELSPGKRWTDVLEESDVARGREPGRYHADDPQAQLKMITERLGRWGYPFETGSNRPVATYGQQLRMFRNGWAHRHVFEDWDAVRVHDALAKLLELLGDDEGADEALDMRQRVMRSLPGTVEAQLQAANQELLDNLQKYAAQAPSTVNAAPVTRVRADASRTPTIGDVRLEYEPWRVIGQGRSTDLDHLQSETISGKVTEVANEIVDFEWPIAMSRLVTLIAREFGTQKLHSKKSKGLVRLLRKTGFVIDEDDFVWPRGVDPQQWAEFRPGGGRPLHEISPIEIRNAARVLLADDPTLEGEHLERQVLAIFGRTKLTAQARRDLSRALSEFLPQ